MSLSVVVFCPQFRPVIGGAERQAEKLAITLASFGCRVTILTLRIDPESPDSEEFNGVVIQRFSITDLSRRYSVRGIALLNIPYILWQIARVILPKLKNADVLHCHIASLPTAGAALAGRISGVPVIVTAHTAKDRSDLGEIEKAGASGRLVAWLARLLIQAWVAPSIAVQEALIRAGVVPEKITRISNGVELPDVSNNRPLIGQIRRFLYLGRLSMNAQRDVPTLVKAFDRLAVEFPGIELAIVGDGDLFDETKQLVKTCNSSGHIYMPGFDEPEKWLAWADCFVLPSRYEGLSVALLEAMAAGLPCIANDILPNREVLDGGKAGVLVPVGDTEFLFREMLRMITETEWAIAIGSAATGRIKDMYSIEITAQKYFEFYKNASIDAKQKI